jgi:hypothetical protein
MQRPAGLASSGYPSGGRHGPRSVLVRVRRRAIGASSAFDNTNTRRSTAIRIRRGGQRPASHAGSAASFAGRPTAGHAIVRFFVSPKE